VEFAPMHFVFDEAQYEPPADQKAFIYEGRTYLPIRFVGYLLNKHVEWDQGTYTVSLSEPTEEQAAEIAAYRDSYRVEREILPIDPKQIAIREIRVGIRQVTFLFDGEAKSPKPEQGVPGIFYQQRLFVPLRFLTEAAGREIAWDPQTYAVRAARAADSDDSAAPQLEPGSDMANNKTPGSASGGAGGGTNPPSGGADPSPQPTKPSAQSLIDAAYAEANELEAACYKTLYRLGGQYFDAKDQATRDALIAQGYKEFDRCKARFEAIVSELDAELAKYGYDRSEAAKMRARFEEEVDKVRKLAESML